MIAKRSSGFSLIEVLITLIVLSVGLLGLAALQARAIEYNQGAFLRSQANILAYDIADRMRINRIKALAGDYNIALSGTAPAGTGLSDLDLKEWLDTSAAALPAGDGAVSCTNVGLCTITVAWKEPGKDEDFTFTYQARI